jgi:hypothetical protein
MEQFDVKCVSKVFPGNSPNAHDVGEAHELRVVHFDGGLVVEQQVSAQVPEAHSPDRQSLSELHDPPPCCAPSFDVRPSHAGFTQ